MSAILKSIESFATKHGMRKSEPYLVGVSGGRDSVALLRGLFDCGFSSLVVAHLNHLLRGEESEADEEFVKRLAKKLSVDCITQREAVEELPGSMETAARAARYRFFKECLKTINGRGVFLGHHADDQAETVLFNLFRGGAGLQGMEELKDREDYSVYRPFLQLRRQQLDLYLESKHQDYRDDSSNFLAIATRNRLRNELIPLIQNIMGRDCIPMLQRAAHLERLKTEALENSIPWQEFYDPQGRLYLPALEKAEQWVQLEVIKRYLAKEKVPELSFDLIQRCQELLTNSTISKVNLPSDRHFCRKAKRLFCI